MHVICREPHCCWNATLYGQRLQKFIGKQRLHHPILGKACFQQLFDICKSLVFRTVQNNCNTSHSVSGCSLRQTPAGLLGMTRFKANMPFIRTGKRILIDKFRCFSPQKIPPRLKIGLQGFIFRQSLAQFRQIPCSCALFFIIIALRIRENRLMHTEVKCMGVHLHHKRRNAAAHTLR